MSLEFFHANKASTGSMVSISFNSKTDKENEKGDKSFYVRIINQSGWNDSNRTGSFKEGKKIVIKFSPLEIAGLIRAMERNTSLAEMMGQEYVYHDSTDFSTVITFQPIFKKKKQGNEWVNTDVQIGFGLGVVKTNKANKTEEKERGFIGFNFAESHLLKLYLIDGLNHIFNALHAQDISAKKVKKASEPPVEPSPEPQQEQAPVADF